MTNDARPTEVALATAVDAAQHVTEVDGIPCFWAPVPGRTTVGLVFRAGVADETFAWRGATHLVEHLAHASIRRVPYDYNAYVGLSHTELWASGEPEAVADHFAEIAHGLTHIDDERVQLERRVLDVESRHRSISARERLLRWRFGVTGYGAGAVHEWGLAHLTAADARDWAARAFNRANAALYVYGEPPAGLRVPLPDGTPVPTPPVQFRRPGERPTPGWANLAGSAAFDMYGPNSSPLRTFAQVLGWRMHARLRDELGVAYDTNVHYEALDGHTAQLWHAFDCEPGEILADAVHEVLVIVRSLAEHGATDDELDAVADSFEHGLRDVYANGVDARRRALQRLIGIDAPSRAAQRRDLIEPDRDAIVAAARDAAASMVLAAEGITPCDDECEGTLLLQHHEVWPDQATDGDEFTSAGALASAIRVGDEAISELFPHGGAVTFPWREVQGLARWADGGTIVQGLDGRINIAPSEWTSGAELVAAIDAAAARHGIPVVAVPD